MCRTRITDIIKYKASIEDSYMNDSRRDHPSNTSSNDTSSAGTDNSSDRDSLVRIMT